MLQWNILDSKEQLESIIEESYQSPQVIFKHSTTCPISSMAKRRLEQNWAVTASPYFLDLIRHRSISNEIADRLNVVHESPQIILVKDGKAIYDESHLDISVDSLTEALPAQNG